MSVLLLASIPTLTSKFAWLFRSIANLAKKVDKSHLQNKMADLLKHKESVRQMGAEHLRKAPREAKMSAYRINLLELAQQSNASTASNTVGF